jgi:hypothetical protein
MVPKVDIALSQNELDEERCRTAKAGLILHS